MEKQALWVQDALTDGQDVTRILLIGDNLGDNSCLVIKEAKPKKPLQRRLYDYVFFHHLFLSVPKT